MPEGLPGATPSPPARRLPRFRGGFAWTVILLLVALVAVLQIVGRDRAAGSGDLAERILEKQVRVQYGLQEFAKSAGGFSAAERKANLEVMRDAMGSATPAMRQRFAAVAGDLGGPAAAREVLDRLDALLLAEDRSLEGEEAAVQEALRTLYAGDGTEHEPAAVDALPEGKRDLLRRRLGWFGTLALAPEGSPDRASAMEGTGRIALLVALVGALGLGLLSAGIVAALVYWMRVASGGARFRLERSPTPPGVYAETFAIWLAWFVALGVVAGMVGGAGGSRRIQFGTVAAAQILSLLALAWPVIRGVPWRQVRIDLGLRFSDTPVRDTLAGFGCWLLGLPIVTAVAIATFVAAALVAALGRKGDSLGSPTPGHPIVDEIAGGLSWIPVVILASVLAPLVEEIFFRGVLYRHLRETTWRHGRSVSIAVSALVSGIVFGAIHPQGLLFAPLLGAIAWPLVHAREWRDSLVAPMAAHALHNGLVTAAVWLFFGA